MPDLAVIMSIYKNDRLEFVRQSVQSILDQTFSDFHYFLIFDGPVAAAVDCYVTSLTDERIRFYSLENNGGLSSALNFLLEKVMSNPEYKLIARMDADDISVAERFEKQRIYLLANPDVSILGSWFKVIDDTGKFLALEKLPEKHEPLKRRFFIRSPFAHPSVMYKRNLIETVGYYPTNTILMEDAVLWGKALKHDLKFANIQECLLKFRKDKDFYRRRSGINYGWNYINTRFKINMSIKAPLYSYFFSFFFGILKMMPAIIIKQAYLTSHKF